MSKIALFRPFQEACLEDFFGYIEEKKQNKSDLKPFFLFKDSDNETSHTEHYH